MKIWRALPRSVALAGLLAGSGYWPRPAAGGPAAPGVAGQGSTFPDPVVTSYRMSFSLNGISRSSPQFTAAQRACGGDGLGG